VPNEHEVELLGGVDALLEQGVETIVVTRGGAGVTVVERHDGATTQRSFDAFAVDPVDTTGAGDAFCGALAARLAGGEPLDRAVRFAAGAGALATTTAGAVPSLPRRVDIESLIA
jgi:ribokinase